MEYLIVIAVAVAFAIFDDRVRGKKKVPPPTVPQDIPRPQKRAEKGRVFDIPPIRGIPADVQVTVDAEVLREQELRIKWEEAQRAKRAREREERAARLAAEEAQAAAVLPRAAVRETAMMFPQLTPDTMKRAVVLAEVLGKPRALRRFPRR